MPWISNAGKRTISSIVLILACSLVIWYSLYIQFSAPTLYGEDSYYHLAIAKFIKDFGPRYEFHWAQFSTFKDCFSDKDFLFHVSIIPFLYLAKDIVLSGKYAVIFYDLLFLLAYVFILRRYLPNLMCIFFLVLPFLSSTFNFYLSTLRAVTLANILTILGIYFLINKKWIKLLLLTLFYSLSHVTFIMFLVYAVIAEIIRYFVHKEFFLKNIYAVGIGMALGFFLHPNFPHNFLSFYLNGILINFYSFINPGIDFGEELFSLPSKIVFLSNFAVFFTLNIILWMSLSAKIKISLSTFIWWACSSIYIFLASFSNRYWYNANILFFIFFASYLNDWIQERGWQRAVPKIKLFVLVYLMIVGVFVNFTFKGIKDTIDSQVSLNLHYENVARWMEKNIPAGEIIYHSFWYDSPYFVCLNPKDDYIVVLDPIYMFWRYPREYSIYKKLAEGRIYEIREVINKIFKANYGYVRKDAKLYKEIVNDPTDFKILYEDYLGIVFKIVK